MALVQFRIHGAIVPCPAEVEAEGPAAMQAWLDAEKKARGPKAAPKAVKSATDPTPEKEG